MSVGSLPPRALAVGALVLALFGIALGLGGHGGGATVAVLVAGRTLEAGRPIDGGSLRVTHVPAEAVSPTMLSSEADAIGRVPAIEVRAGEYLTRSLLASGGGAPALRRGERALTLRVDAAAAPTPAALRPGRRVDVVVALDADAHGPARTVVAASALQLIAPTRGIGDALVVTVRARVPQALRLAAAEGYGRELRLLLRAPGDAQPAARVAVSAAALRKAPDA